MLDKESVNLLKVMQAAPGDVSDNIFSYELLERLTGMQHQDVVICAKYLQEQGFVKYSHYEPGHLIAGVHLTQVGKHYSEYRLLQRRDFWLRSVIVPIVCSVAAALLTLWLTK